MLVAALAIAAASSSQRSAHHEPALLAEGVAEDASGLVRDVPPGSTGRFAHRSSVLEGGRMDAVLAARRWLARGDVPGAPRYRDMAERALLDMRLLTLRSGAFVGAWDPGWRYVWPRDAAFAAVALARCGYHGEARSIVDFLSSLQRSDGMWLGRHNVDGTAPQGQHVQADGAGWTLWAASVAGPATRWWPMVARAADAIAASLDARGLPPPSSDYWERHERTVTLGTAAPLLLGLRSAVRVARAAGREDAAGRWSVAASRLDTAITATFGASGFGRTIGSRHADSAVTFLAPPFAPANPNIARALGQTWSRLVMPNGGVRPGEAWRPDTVAWTPETALFALAFAAEGDEARAHEILDWLDAHRTALGSLPEKVDSRGRPVSVAPLGWTAATVLLALHALDDIPSENAHASELG